MSQEDEEDDEEDGVDDVEGDADKEASDDANGDDQAEAPAAWRLTSVLFVALAFVAGWTRCCC